MGIHPEFFESHRCLNVIKKVPDFVKFSENLKAKEWFQIDGGFNFGYRKKLENVGINSFVGGTSSIFNGVTTSMTFLNKEEGLPKH